MFIDGFVYSFCGSESGEKILKKGAKKDEPPIKLNRLCDIEHISIAFHIEIQIHTVYLCTEGYRKIKVKATNTHAYTSLAFCTSKKREHK